jgi:hypothetical protein
LAGPSLGGAWSAAGRRLLFFMGWSGLVWGFFISTVLLYHGTFVTNSLCHMFGKIRYKTADTSRNSFILALVTLGRRMAQQPPLLLGLGSYGIFLVGGRHLLLHASLPIRPWVRVGYKEAKEPNPENV